MLGVKRIIYLLAFFLIFCPQKLNAVGDWTTPDEMEEFYSDESTKLFVYVYLSGLVTGSTFWSDDLCIPDNIAYSEDIVFKGEQYYSIYRNEYVREVDFYQGLFEEYGFIPPIIVLNRGIQYEYPC